MHIGTFTPEGTWDAATRRLPQLAELGVTLLEVMPVADFCGSFGWGYDGVNMFAPTRLYGSPDDFRRFVDRAHALGLGVILDVVYNHFGPDGCAHGTYSDEYFSRSYSTDWGPAWNYDGEGSAPVREFVTANAAYWIQEYHLDGLRLDATQNVFDASHDHILAAITRAAREAAGRRSIFVVAENEPQDVRHLVGEDEGGFGMDAVWNDDFHHTALVALTGRAEAYYSDYRGTPQELLSALKWGYLYQGQWYTWQGQRRGTPALRLDARRFVSFLENHDQVANSGRGLRTHFLSSPARHRALTAIWLLGPATPMLFQGQEFASSSPFHFFADHKAELAASVDAGRKKFLAQFPSLASADMQQRVANAGDRATFERCKLDWSEWDRNAEAVALHRDLLQLRSSDPVLSHMATRVDGAVLGADALAMRYFDERGADRLLLVNLGADLRLRPAPEPLLAEPAGHTWQVQWCSEDPRYGGHGIPPVFPESPGLLPGQSALFLVPRKNQ
jgi:maltooligosyltrehalose trehalohydrolase